jgi:hypothetical protein
MKNTELDFSLIVSNERPIALIVCTQQSELEETPCGSASSVQSTSLSCLGIHHSQEQRAVGKNNGSCFCSVQAKIGSLPH